MSTDFKLEDLGSSISSTTQELEDLGQKLLNLSDPLFPHL